MKESHARSSHRRHAQHDQLEVRPEALDPGRLPHRLGRGRRFVLGGRPPELRAALVDVEAQIRWCREDYPQDGRACRAVDDARLPRRTQQDRSNDAGRGGHRHRPPQPRRHRPGRRHAAPPHPRASHPRHRDRRTRGQRTLRRRVVETGRRASRRRWPPSAPCGIPTASSSAANRRYFPLHNATFALTPYKGKWPEIWIAAHGPANDPCRGRATPTDGFPAPPGQRVRPATQRFTRGRLGRGTRSDGDHPRGNPLHPHRPLPRRDRRDRRLGTGPPVHARTPRQRTGRATAPSTPWAPTSKECKTLCRS